VHSRMSCLSSETGWAAEAATWAVDQVIATQSASTVGGVGKQAQGYREVSPRGEV